jgi:hypothetical protein
MKNEPDQDFGADVAAAIEQLRDVPEEPIEASAEDLGARIAHRMDEQDEARAPKAEDESKHEGPTRDGRGRFSRAAPAGTSLDDPPAGSPPPSGPPVSWSAAAKTEFAKLSPAVQQAVLKREEEVSRGFQQYGERVRQHEQIEQIMAPRRQNLSRFGFHSDAEAINHLVSFSDAYERDPANVIRHLVQHSRLSPQQIFSAPPSPEQQAQMAREQADMASARAQVQAFEQRPPPHYQVARPIMRTLLEMGEAANMKDAYEKAMSLVRSVADGRDSVQRKVRASNASLSGAPYGISSAPTRKGAATQFGDIADDVRAAMAQLGA